MTEQLWKEFNQELLGFINSKVSTKELAEDILQEVFIKIHQNVNTIRDDQKISSWIYQITRNTIIDYYRKRKLNTTELNIESNLVDEGEASASNISNCLKPFIHRLPEKYKEVLLETTYQNVSQKDFAEKHNLSYSAAKSRVQRARRELKAFFIDCCAVESDQYGNVISSNCNC